MPISFNEGQHSSADHSSTDDFLRMSPHLGPIQDDLMRAFFYDLLNWWKRARCSIWGLWRSKKGSFWKRCMKRGKRA